MFEPIPKAPLSEVAEITMGQSPDSAYVNEEEHGWPFLQGCAEFGARHPIAKVHCMPPLRTARAGSTLISVRAPVGAMNRADQDYCIGRGLAAILAKSGYTDNIFLLHAIEENLSFLHRRSQGSTFLAIGTADLSMMPVAAPPLAQQQRIAEILSTVDEAIEQTEALIVKTQQIKAGLMHDLFTRGVTKDGKLRPPREDAPQFYKESPLGWIPKEWRVASLCNIAQVVDSLHRTPDFVEEGYPMVRVTDIKGDELNLDSCIRVTDETFKEFTGNHIPSPGDIVLSRVGTYGIPSFVATKLPFCMGQNTVIITNVSNSRFVYYFLKTEIVKRQFERATVGSSQSTLSLAAIRSCLLSLPSLFEQDRIVQKFDSIFNHLSCAVDEFQKYSVLKQGLMHDLLTGRVRVKTESLPPTESAHV